MKKTNKQKQQNPTMPSIIHCIHRKQKWSHPLVPVSTWLSHRRTGICFRDTSHLRWLMLMRRGSNFTGPPADSQTARHLTERRPDWILPAFFLWWLLATWECLDIQSQFPAVALLENNTMSSAKSPETSEFRVHYNCTSSCEHIWWVEVETSEGANVATP